MTDPGTEFTRELEVFRTEAEAGAQFLYAYLAVHTVAGENRSVVHALNAAPLFWNTALGALQTASFMALGRVFDQQSDHNLDRLLGIAQNNMNIFLKSALAQRKKQASPDADDWLKDFLRDAYEPSATDFRRLRQHVKKLRSIYQGNYRDLRHKLYAHKAVSNHADVEALFKKTNIRELQRLVVFLNRLHEALWQLFFIGRKPVLRPMRFSVKNIRRQPLAEGHNRAVHERVVLEAQHVLKQLVETGPTN